MPGSGISHVQSAQLQRTRWTITATARIFSEFWNPNTVSAALRLRDVCDIQLQSHGNLKRTKSFALCSNPMGTSFLLPSASSFFALRSKSGPRKYENQKRIVRYPRCSDPEIAVWSRIFLTCLQKTVRCTHSDDLCPYFCAGILLSRSFDARNARTVFIFKENKPVYSLKPTPCRHFSISVNFRIAEVLSQSVPRKFQLHSITAIRKSKCSDWFTKNQPSDNAAHKGFNTQKVPDAPRFAAAVSRCRYWIRCRKKMHSARSETGMNAAITQSKRINVFLFASQFVLPEPILHFFSLSHMILILCFWLFLRFWAQNAPNMPRFCTFAPFSCLERLRGVENSPFSALK